jgi:hypothetical protein
MKSWLARTRSARRAVERSTGGSDLRSVQRLARCSLLKTIRRCSSVRSRVHLVPWTCPRPMSLGGRLARGCSEKRSHCQMPRVSRAAGTQPDQMSRGTHWFARAMSHCAWRTTANWTSRACGTSAAAHHWGRRKSRQSFGGEAPRMWEVAPTPSRSGPRLSGLISCGCPRQRLSGLLESGISRPEALCALVPERARCCRARALQHVTSAVRLRRQRRGRAIEVAAVDDPLDEVAARLGGAERLQLGVGERPVEDAVVAAA